MLKYVLSHCPGNRGDSITIHVLNSGYGSVAGVCLLLSRVKRDRPRKIFADVPFEFVNSFLEAGFDYADYADYPVDENWDHKSRCFLMFAPRGL